MAKSTKNNFRPTKRNNYKPVVRMEEGGNVSELNYSERKEYIEQNYAPFITEAQMIFSIWDSGIEYDYKADRNDVVQNIIDSYEKLGDYTESSLPKETIYEIQDWDLVRREIDPETDEVIDETSLKEVTSDNTYNFSYLGLVDLNWRVYYDDVYDRYFYVIMPHLGGDIRGNYGDAIILEGNDKDELFYRFYEGFISGGATVYFKFKDGSEVGFDSEQDSDVFTFRVHEVYEPTGMAEKFLQDFEKFDSWKGDEFLEETIDIFLMRKGIAPKMMGGGRLDVDTPKAYIQILGYDEGKWIDLTDFSDGDDVIDYISDWMNELNQEYGGNREEYEVHDYEGFGKDLYDRYMGSNEFDEILEGYEKFQNSDFPKEVITEYTNDSGYNSMSIAGVIEQMENNYLGKYDNYSDFGYNQVNQGFYSPTDSDVYITDTDKRILAGEEANNEVRSMDFDDLMDRADDTRFEYEKEKNNLEEQISEIEEDIDALTELQNSTDDDDDYDNISNEIEQKELELSDLEESLNNIDGRYEREAINEVEQIIYDEIYDELENNLGSFLERFGYNDELENVSFLSVDYESIGEYLASDYLVVEYEGSIYIFNNYSKGGRIKATKAINKYDFYIVENSTKKLVSGYSTKAEAVQQRALLVEQYPAMRFEIYPLAKLEEKTELDVNSKKDYVELSTLDKIKKVSVDTYRYGKEKVGQAKVFLEKNDVKGKIKRGARKVADKTKQGADWLRKQWIEADFGDGTGRAKFFDLGGEVYRHLPLSLKKRYDRLKGRVNLTKENCLEAYRLHTERGMGGSSVGYYLFNAESKRDSQTFGDIAIDLGRFFNYFGDKFADGGEIIWVDNFELDQDKINRAKYIIKYNRGNYTIIDNKTKEAITSFPTQISAVNYINTKLNKLANGGSIREMKRFRIVFVDYNDRVIDAEYNKEFGSIEMAIDYAEEVLNDGEYEGAVNYSIIETTPNKKEIDFENYKSKYANGGGVDEEEKEYTYNNLIEIFSLKEKGFKTISLNGFNENIGYVIDLKLNDEELIKVGDRSYETTYKNGGGVDYEPMTKPVPTTKPSTQPTKPDKNNPYKPKGIPKPKATKL